MTDFLTPPDKARDKLVKTTVAWFDTTELKDASIYSTPTRVVGLFDPTEQHSIYGLITGPSAGEPDDTWPALISRDGVGTFVGDIQLVVQALGGMKVDGPGAISAANLRWDERVVLGLDQRTDIRKRSELGDWDCPVLGHIELGQYADGFTLRPQKASFKQQALSRTLEFTEVSPATPVKAPSTDSLSVSLKLLSEDEKGSRVSELAMPVSLFLDEAPDGGWEAVSPLWIKTTEGFLRVVDHQAKVSYGLLRESRSIEVSSWFDGLPEGARVRLLLDRSGTKRLKIQREGDAEAASVVLTVDFPALVLMLPQVTCSTVAMVDRMQPPGGAQVAGGPLLHLVSKSLHHGEDIEEIKWRLGLAGAAKLTLSLSKAGESALLPGKTGEPAVPLPPSMTLTHFTAKENWVRPPQAAVNEENADMSVLRVLLPKRWSPKPGQEAPDVQLVITPSGVEASTFVEIDVAEATRFGPLARFEVLQDAGQVALKIDEELSAGATYKTEKFSGQPAVLRPQYRGESGDETAALATFDATYVHAGAIPPAIDERSALHSQAMVTDGTRWVLNKDKEVDVRRDDFVKGVPSRQFGWWNSARFFDGTKLASSSYPSAWIETEKGAQWKAWHWLRLGDDSLARWEAVDAALPVDPHSGNIVPGWIPAKPFTLISRDMGSAGQGLNLFILEEELTAGESRFSLSIEGVNIWRSAPGNDPRVVNRLVIAVAKQDEWPVLDKALQDGVVVKTLNRVFLELERFGAAFRVRRGMLGWGASKVFGMDATVGAEFHVTEFYERTDVGLKGVLKRAVEFNGAAKTAKINGPGEQKYQATVYFWSSTLADSSSSTEPRYLRVICGHDIYSSEEKKITVSALQDAMVVNGELDLTVDIVILGEDDENSEDSQSAADVWEPSRRNLFSVQVDAIPGTFLPRAFLKIRYRNETLYTVGNPGGPAAKRPMIFSSWERCNREVTPWFSDESRDRRANATWYRSPMLLRTAAGPLAAVRKMQVSLWPLGGFNDLKAGVSVRASTLAGAWVDSASEKEPPGVPQWMPSPIRQVNVPDAPVSPKRERVCRIWLFDPWPRIISQWDGSTDAADSPRAKQKLGRLGWTREAVFEISTPTADTWKVIDSPLLNRDAWLNWFGWPLAPGAQHPNDGSLPLTTQVVHIPEKGVTACSVQVTFKLDVGKSGQRRIPMVYSLPTLPLSESTAIFTKIEFRTQGLRVGVPHQIVTYGGSKPVVLDVEPSFADKPAVMDRPDLKLESKDSLKPDCLIWGQQTVKLPTVRPSENRAARLVFGAPVDCWRVSFTSIPPGLQANLDGKSWQELVPRIPIELTKASDGIEVRMPPGMPWSVIRLVLENLDSAKTVTGSQARMFFKEDAASNRLAGLFVNNELVAFGKEPIRFTAEKKPDETDENASWTRYAAIELPAKHRAGDKVYVASINLLGDVLVNALDNT